MNELEIGTKVTLFGQDKVVAVTGKVVDVYGGLWYKVEYYFGYVKPEALEVVR